MFIGEAACANTLRMPKWAITAAANPAAISFTALRRGT
jgi:hypothetical protein